MTAYGLDVSANDAGLSLASSWQLGYRFCTARALSFPKGSMTPDSAFADFRDQARTLGMPFACYVLVHDAFPPAAIAQALAAVLAGEPVPVMIDAEPDWDVPNLAFVAACYDAFRAAGLSPVSLYDPRWYWSEQKGPALTIRPWRLVASNYGSNAAGNPAARYAALGGDRAAGWDPYGGLTPTLLQFGSQVNLGAQPGGGTRFGDADATRLAVADLVNLGMFTDWGDPLSNITPEEFAAAIWGFETQQNAADVPAGDPVPIGVRFANAAAREADVLIPAIQQLVNEQRATNAALSALITLLSPKT